MSWCSHHPTCESVMVYSTGLRRRVVQSVGVTAAVSAGCMMCLAWLVETVLSPLSALRTFLWPGWWRQCYLHFRLCLHLFGLAGGDSVISTLGLAADCQQLDGTAGLLDEPTAMPTTTEVHATVLALAPTSGDGASSGLPSRKEGQAECLPEEQVAAESQQLKRTAGIYWTSPRRC